MPPPSEGRMAVVASQFTELAGGKRISTASTSWQTQGDAGLQDDTEPAWIFNLDDDVLIEIFKLTLPLPGFWPLCRFKQLLDISHVSRRWRRVALACRSLWAYVHYGYPALSTLFISRSGDAAIDVDMSTKVLALTYNNPHSRGLPICHVARSSLFKRILTLSPRIRTLRLPNFHVDSRCQSMLADFAMLPALPHLTHLTLEEFWTFENFPMRLFLTSKLQFLWLYRCKADVSLTGFRFPNLTELVLDRSFPGNLFSVLSGCPALKHLSIEIWPFDSDIHAKESDYHTASVVLLKLKTLYLKISSLQAIQILYEVIERLRAPELAILEVRVWSWRDVFYGEDLQNHVDPFIFFPADFVRNRHPQIDLLAIRFATVWHASTQAERIVGYTVDGRKKPVHQHCSYPGGLRSNGGQLENDHDLRDGLGFNISQLVRKSSFEYATFFRDLCQELPGIAHLILQEDACELLRIFGEKSTCNLLCNVHTLELIPNDSVEHTTRVLMLLRASHLKIPKLICRTASLHGLADMLVEVLWHLGTRYTEIYCEPLLDSQYVDVVLKLGIQIVVMKHEQLTNL